MKEILEPVDIRDPEFKSLIEKGFEIKEYVDDLNLVYVKPRYGHKSSFDMLLEDLAGKDLYPLYRIREKGPSIQIINRSRNKRDIRPLYHGGLIILTIFTVTIAGYIWWAGGDLINSIFFTLGLMGILGGHELGHALIARRNKVDATLPFFLPVPPFFAFGTLGAVIFMNSPIPDRRSLFDIGVAGPITGFLLSIPVLILGISLSEIAPLDPTHTQSPFLLGTSLLFDGISYLLHGPLRADQIMIAHPIAIAGWGGLFVTALNLFPMGQLDGGHVIRAVFPKRYGSFYKGVFRILFLMGVLGFISQSAGPRWLASWTWPGWLIWAVFVYFMTRLEHPGPLNDVDPLDSKRKLAALGVLIMFILSFTPAPIVSV